MNAKRALRLRREVLTELAAGELELVIGGETPTAKISACHSLCLTCAILRCDDPGMTFGCAG